MDLDATTREVIEDGLAVVARFRGAGGPSKVPQRIADALAQADPQSLANAYSIAIIEAQADGNSGDAIEAARALLAQPPAFTAPDVVFEAGRSALHAGDLDLATAALERLGLGSGGTSDGDAASLRGGVAALRGDVAGALAGYRTALAIYHDHGLRLDVALNGLDMAALLPRDLPEVRGRRGRGPRDPRRPRSGAAARPARRADARSRGALTRSPEGRAPRRGQRPRRRHRRRRCRRRGVASVARDEPARSALGVGRRAERAQRRHVVRALEGRGVRDRSRTTRSRAAGPPTRTRARSSRRPGRPGWPRPAPARCAGPPRRSSRRPRPTRRALTASAPLWTPEVAARPTPAPSWGRRIAIQRSGSRSSDGCESDDLGDARRASRGRGPAGRSG